MTVQVVRVEERLPDGLDVLRKAARSEGLRNLETLVREWESGVRFDGPGEALFAGYLDGRLAGVGGVGVQGGDPGVMRMRRLYVLPSHRRRGVGRALAGAMIQQGLQSARRLTCNASASPAAAPFWEALGFRRDAGGDWTHVLVVP